MSQTIAVIGASRGIGLELATQLSRTPNTVVLPTSRSSPPSVELPNTKFLTLDITSDSSVTAAVSQVPALDTLIINAAIGSNDTLLSTSSSLLTSYLDSNVLGPHRVIRAFLPALRARPTKKIIIISSSSGSLTIQKGAKVGFQGPYSVSKAAVNMLAMQYHNELAEEGFTVVVVHPGWVATDMGNVAGSGGMAVEKSAAGVLKVIKGLKNEDSGRFFDWEGKEMPW